MGLSLANSSYGSKCFQVAFPSSKSSNNHFVWREVNNATFAQTSTVQILPSAFFIHTIFYTSSYSHISFPLNLVSNFQD